MSTDALLSNSSETLAKMQHGRLRRMQAVAAAMLVVAASLWALAHVVGHGQGAWGYLAAFAEAALIGGLADWFAVVALFRRPLGLPIWHTAIIPSRKDEIATSLGDFVERHLVTPEALGEHLPKADLAGQFTLALQGPAASERLGQWLAAMAPSLIDGLDDTLVSTWLAAQVRQTLARVDGSALVGRAGDRLVNEAMHQRLVDGMARGVSDYLADPDHLPAISDFLAQAMNIDNPMVKTMIKAAAPKAVTGLVSWLDELQANPEHPWRRQFDVWVTDWLAQARTSKVWQVRVQHWQADLLDSPGLNDWLIGLWPEVKVGLRQRLSQDQDAVGKRIAAMLRSLGQGLSQDAPLRQRINDGLAQAASSLATQHRGAAARFLAQQLSRWSADEVSQKVELAIGRDLQFIRINGTVVGGLIGLALHALAQWH